MLELKLEWKLDFCWVCDLQAIIVHKSLNFVTYSRRVVDNPLLPMTPPTFVIELSHSFKCWIVLPTKFMSGWAIVQIDAQR